VHKLEGQVTSKFSTNSAAVELDAERIGNNDTVGIIGTLAITHQSRRGKVGIRVLELAVESNTVLALVGRGKRGEREGLLQVGARGDGATFLGFQAGDLTGELVVGHGKFHMLDNGTLDVLDGLLTPVVDAQISLDLFTVVEKLFVEGQLHVELARGQSEALGHQGAGLTLAAGSRSELDLPDGEADGVALVGALIAIVTDEDAQVVDDTKGLGSGFFSCVELDGSGGALGDGDSEWVGIGPQLLHEAVLDIGGFIGGGVGVDLLAAEGQLLAEVEAHDLILLAAETVRDRNDGIDPAAAEVVIITDYDAIDRFSSGGVVDKVATA